MMFGRLLGWCTVYTFSGAHAPLWNFAWCKIHFKSKSCVLLYWQSSSAKLRHSAVGTTYIWQGCSYVGHRPKLQWYFWYFSTCVYLYSVVVLSITCIFMAALCSRYGHYIFVLWFLLLSFFFFSSPNVSRWRLDVYHTSSRDVALVQI